MNARIPAHQSGDLNAAIRRRLIQIVLLLVIQAVALFLPAGRLDWWMAWAYLAFYVVMVAINAAILLPRSPEMIAERGQAKAGTKAWDKRVSTAFGLFSLSILVVAGLDKRFGWTPELMLSTQLVALALVILSTAVFSWAMMSNPFFSSLVRIQTERGHTVAKNGPYQIVRHPGYASQVVSMLALPVALGSFWALIPALLTMITLIVRTSLEDRTLQAELPGYADFAQRVRYRLLPGVW